MKVSLNTVKRYTDVDLSVDELVTKINEQLGGVETVLDLNARYKDAVIVRVVTCEDHPRADRLHVCLVDDAGVVLDVERDENGLVQVVCGAPNARAGMLAVWLPPGSTVPASFADKEPFVLASRELRGVVSYGMLASPQELALGDSHEGILELDPNEPLPTGVSLEPGSRFASVYGLDDTIIEIENKMFTHRPDCFGQLGVAREIAGIQGKRFYSPSWYKDAPSFAQPEDLLLTVRSKAADKVPRFMAVAIKGVTIGPSPVWLQSELVRLGSKPINNVVDVTNYLMLLTGQPLHAYDYDTLRGNLLGNRFAKEGETITLLNGKTYTLTPDDIVIVDDEGPVGLGGVMGGGESEVSDETTNIVLECATFDMYAIRKTSMRHGLFTDAVTRFNKGQSPLQNDRVLALAIQTVIDAAGGSVASPVYDDAPTVTTPPSVSVDVKFINERLGLNLDQEAVRNLLENVEFTVETDGTLRVTPPFWRTDISLAEDVVEEVGRLYGFDKLPRVLPPRTIKPAPKNIRRALKQQIRDSLSRSGSNEVLTYSFVHEKTILRAEQDVSTAFRLSNALSPDLQYYRLSVLPSLLDKVHANIKAGHDEFILFEIGKGHTKSRPADDEGLPREYESVDMVYSSKKAQEGAAFYRMRQMIAQLMHDLGIEAVYKPLNDSVDEAMTAPFERRRSAVIETRSGVRLGVVGELKHAVRKSFKLPEYCAGASLDFDGLMAAASQTFRSYIPLSRYPKVSQDISLKVPTATAYASLDELVRSIIEEYSRTGAYYITVRPVTIYQPQASETKTITLHIEVTSYERTLTDGDVSGLLDTISQQAAKELQAERT